ncbi:MAG: T9SS type A sorting domain-containing protein [Bacteroidetes bacterium]|nr:T9SS type A sorting domain-containing protein [Bacteroidota bacterium]
MKSVWTVLFTLGLTLSTFAQEFKSLKRMSFPDWVDWTVLTPNPVPLLSEPNQEKTQPWGQVMNLLPGQGSWIAQAQGHRIQYSVGFTMNQVKATIPVLQGFFPQAGEQLWLLSNRELRGPFDFRHANSRGDFAVPPISGDSLCLIWETTQAIPPNWSISHLWYEPSSEKSGFGSAGPCNIDVECLGQNQLKDAMVLILSPTGARRCTGTLLNNTAQDGSPLILTARHCNTSSESIFVFDYFSPSCGGPDAALNRSVQGAVKLASSSISDGELWKLDRNPLPQWKPFWAGWNRSDSVPGPAYYGLHHPRGDVLKHSKAEMNGLGRSTYLGAVSGTGAYLRVNRWATGTTEPGSSGSPLIQAETNQLVGHLRGGYAACGNELEDYYGGLFAGWAGLDSARSLGVWLDPIQQGTAALPGGYYPQAALDVDFELLAPEPNLYCLGQPILAGIVNWGRICPDSVSIELKSKQGTVEWKQPCSMAFSDTLWLDLRPKIPFALGSDSLELRLILPEGMPDEYPADNLRSAYVRINPAPINTIQYSHPELKQAELRILDTQGNLIWKRASTDSVSGSTTDTLCLGIACVNISWPDWHETPPAIPFAEIRFKGLNQELTWNSEAGWEDKNWCQPSPLAEDKAQVFPNPSQGEGYYYAPPQHVGGTIWILDSHGKRVAAFDAQPETMTALPKIRLASGLYFLVPANGGESVKWIVQ